MKVNNKVPGIGYLQQAAPYLSARGTSIFSDRIELSPRSVFARNSFALRTITSLGETIDEIIHPEGWAWRIRLPSGEFATDNLLIRPNWPTEGLVLAWEDNQLVEKPIPPKFLYYGSPAYLNDATYWASTMGEIANSDHLIIAEKYTVAVILADAGFKAIGLSGCFNFAFDGALTPELERALRSLKLKAKIIILFDKDLETNGGVEFAAKRFLRFVLRIRHDLRVVFIKPPEEHGWDDWWAKQGDNAKALFEEILCKEAGVEVHPIYEPLELHRECGTPIVATKGGGVRNPHSLDAYTKYLAFLPELSNLVFDTICKGTYLNGNYGEKEIDPKELFSLVKRLLETCVYYTDNDTRIKDTDLRAALYSLIKKRERPVFLDIIDKNLYDPNIREEFLYAEEFIKVAHLTSAMPLDELVQTLARLARDQVHTWAESDTYHLECFLGLSGPPNSGKTFFVQNMLSGFKEYGFNKTISTTYSPPAKGDFHPFHRLTCCMPAVVIDELHADRATGRNMLSELMMSVTNWEAVYRDPYGREESSHRRMALTSVTTTDPEYLVGGAEEGAARRCLPFTLEGGKGKPEHVEMGRTWLKVLSCARHRQLAEDDLKGTTTEFSSHHVAEVFTKPPALDRAGNYWRRSGKFVELATKLMSFPNENTVAGEIRFTAPMLWDIIAPNDNLDKWERAEMEKYFMSLGADRPSRKRLSGGREGGESMRAMSVKAHTNVWGVFIREILLRLK